MNDNYITKVPAGFAIKRQNSDRCQSQASDDHKLSNIFNKSIRSENS